MDKLRKHRAVVERQAGNDLVSTVGGMQAGYAESVTRATLIDGTFHLAALKHERRCPDPRMLGFSLIELLVVVVIIGMPYEIADL